VVDDEPTIREMVGFALSRAGFSWIEAADAVQAEAEISRDLPDLIVLDWMLPGRSGIEFIKGLRSDPVTRSLPVIMLTARREETDKVRGLKDGADDSITKPFPPSELIDRIESAEVALFDVRNPAEWNAGHIAQAQHVFLGSLTESMDQFSKDKTNLIQCRSGARSAVAASILQAAGYRVMNLTGGIIAWNQAGLQVVTANEPQTACGI